MLLSEKHGFAFVHIQKTGGASVEAMLMAASPDVAYHNPRHMDAHQARKVVGDWDRLFRFAFVRNPWDRLVSWYAMIDRARRFEAGELAEKPTPEQLAHRRRRLRKNPLLNHAAHELTKDPTFESFVRRCTGVFQVRGMTLSFAWPQTDYFTEPAGGRSLVSFVGRFERLKEDLGVALEEIGLGKSLTDTVPHRNRSEHGRYQDYYDSELREIVAERFARDIERFGYEFEP